MLYGPQVARQITLRHEAAEALPQHHRLDDAQRVAQPHDVVGEGVQRPLGRGPAVAAAVAAVVDIDHLRHVGQAAEDGLEAAVVVARAAVQQQQYESFVQTELHQRSLLNYPPYGRLILLKFSGLSPGIVQTTAVQVAAALHPLQEQGVERLGPAAASIERVARRYRWQILLKVPATVAIAASFLSNLRDLCPNSVSFAIDIDPLSIG